MSEMIYTEVDRHLASPRERVQMLGLMWRTAGEPGVSVKDRRLLRRRSVRYVLTPWAKACTYLVNWGDGRGTDEIKQYIQ